MDPYQRSPFSWLAAACAFASTACDAQADPGYPGEPLATIRGTLVNELSPAPNVDAVLVWFNSARNGDISVGVKTDVDGSFPASFTMSMYAPPPIEGVNDFTHGGTRPEESRIGIAAICAVQVGKTNVQDEDDVAGFSENHVLVWVETDIRPGTFSEAKMHGRLKAGYHLMKVVRLTEAEEAAAAACRDALPPDASVADWEACGPIFDQLYEADDGFGTHVEVRIAPPDELNAPNWT